MRLEDSMEERTRGGFEIVDRQLVAEGTDLRVKVLTLAAGQCVSGTITAKSPTPCGG
jgi:hypothetical protein